ncbi:unnamed protein product [Trichobilharzia regenti]|nr:unnamed protein product [Trichobilharzia regenti]
MRSQRNKDRMVPSSYSTQTATTVVHALFKFIKGNKCIKFLKYSVQHFFLLSLFLGGYMSLMAAVRYHHVYRAAIAVSPVVDWALYDSAYTERYIGLPEDNPDAYNCQVKYIGRSSRTGAVRLAEHKSLTKSRLVDPNKTRSLENS